MLFRIKEPIWKHRAVGLDENKLEDENEVKIDYVDKNRNKTFPFCYHVTKEEALKHPVMIIKRHKLRIVPISCMDY